MSGPQTEDRHRFRPDKRDSTGREARCLDCGGTLVNIRHAARDAAPPVPEGFEHEPAWEQYWARARAAAPPVDVTAMDAAKPEPHVHTTACVGPGDNELICDPTPSPDPVAGLTPTEEANIRDLVDRGLGEEDGGDWFSPITVAGLLASLDAARAAAPPVEPETVYSCPFPGCARQKGHVGPCLNQLFDVEPSVPPSPDPVAGLREAAVTSLAIHLHQKGVGCDGHQGDDRAVADVMHRDDAYDIYDHLAAAALLASDKPGPGGSVTLEEDAAIMYDSGLRDMILKGTRIRLSEDS